ncbi:hypothetical protein SEA_FELIXALEJANDRO_3 [Gordonia phage FelixAlejandro]|nr:hypothetical protein SEA_FELIXALEJANDRO_3 [Gordonia phage FelixAlejandro]
MSKEKQELIQKLKSGLMKEALILRRAMPPSHRESFEECIRTPALELIDLLEEEG